MLTQLASREEANMQNLCGKCGGGFGQYTAPEARCTCSKQVHSPEQKKPIRHALAVAEANFLMSMGWEPLDVMSGTEGYTWKAPEAFGGHHPIGQRVAVEVQKRIDEATVNPVKESWLRGISTTKLIEASNENNKIVKMRTAEMNLQRQLHF
jgi:hypothetical protein